jgi:hypothetical protein
LDITAADLLENLIQAVHTLHYDTGPRSRLTAALGVNYGTLNRPLIRTIAEVG